MLIRDDASQNGTPTLLRKLALQYANIQLIDDHLGQLGAGGNFAYLLKTAYDDSADYVLCADQDDIWMPEKIQLLWQQMQKIEHTYPATPILLHSDMEVVDASLQSIHPSFMAYQGINHEPHSPLQILLAQNFITGCTMMINRSLLEFSLPMPKEALLHDWWLALCAAVFGRIEYIDQPLVKYRQHEGNEVGAKHLRSFLNPLSGKWKFRWLEGQKNLFQSMKQAHALAERIREHDPRNSHLPLVKAYAALERTSRFQRVKTLKKLNIRAQSQARQALLLSRLLLTPKDWNG